MEVLGRSDGAELTFRRGWPSELAAITTIDEKIYLCNCAAASAEPLQQDRAVLYDVTGIRDSSTPLALPR